ALRVLPMPGPLPAICTLSLHDALPISLFIPGKSLFCTVVVVQKPIAFADVAIIIGPSAFDGGVIVGNNTCTDTPPGAQYMPLCVVGHLLHVDSGFVVDTAIYSVSSRAQLGLVLPIIIVYDSVCRDQIQKILTRSHGEGRGGE